MWERWEAQVLEHLRACKRLGVPWELAAQDACCAYPGTTNRYPRRTEDIGQSESLAEFLWRVWEHAYVNTAGEPGSGNGPALAGWRPETVREWLAERDQEPGLAA